MLLFAGLEKVRCSREVQNAVTWQLVSVQSPNPTKFLQLVNTHILKYSWTFAKRLNSIYFSMLSPLSFSFIISLVLFGNHLGFNEEIWLCGLTKLLLLVRMLVQELHHSSVLQGRNDFLSEAHEVADK